jgi:hypothetical protein
VGLEPKDVAGSLFLADAVDQQRGYEENTDEFGDVKPEGDFADWKTRTREVKV